MSEPVEAFIDRIRSVQPLAGGNSRRLAIRQKITETENMLRRDASMAIPLFLQRARDRAFKEVARHSPKKVTTRTAEFFQEVFEELSLLTRLTIREHKD